MSKCIILSGPSGAGKSTYAHKLLEEALQSSFSAIVVSSDEIRDCLYGGKFCGKFNNKKEKELWDIFFTKVKTFAKLYDIVILDSTCLTNKKRLKWYKLLRKHFKQFELFIVNRSLEVCVYQDSKRDRHVPAKDISQQIEVFQEPNDQIKKLFKVYKV